MYLAVFDACDTANPSSDNNLPIAAVNAGAENALGFNSVVFVDETNDWLRNFLKRYLIGEETIEAAASNAIQDGTTMNGKIVIYSSND